MAREVAIPSTSTFIQDYGLNVVPQPAARNRRVVILGTAEDGPMYEPVLVDKPEDSEIVWGNAARGTLVRGISECWNAQEGNPNVVGVRIGSGAKSVLEILERDSSGTGEEQPDNSGAGVISLTLTARFPGSKYNEINIKYDDRRNVAIYNPKTGLTSLFTIDINNPNNSTVDAHNVKELADAINADRNLNTVLTASVADLTTDYELKVRSTTAGINQSSTGITMDLQTMMNVSGLIQGETTAFMVPKPVIPYEVDEIDANGTLKNLTVANNLIEITDIESVSHSEWEKLVFDGTSSSFAITPLDGKGTQRWDTIQAMYDYDSDSQYMDSPSGNVVSEFVYSLDKALVNQVPTDLGGLDGANTITITTPLPIDDSEETYPSGVGLSWLNSNTDYSDDYFNPGTSGYEKATCQYVETKKIANKEIRPTGVCKVLVSDDVDPNGNWVQLPYCYDSGIYVSSHTDATSTVAAYTTLSIGSAAYLANSGGFDEDTVNDIKFTNMAQLVDGSGLIRDKKYVRIEAYTVKGLLTEAETLPQLEAVDTTVPSTYFVKGSEITMNTAPAFPMLVNYGTRIKYEPDVNVTLSDAVKGEIKFTNPDQLPGPGGNALSSSSDSYIRFNYKYLPNFPLITSAVQALRGGTNGANLNTKELEEEFKTSYNYLRDFPATLWVPMEAFIDSVKEDYNNVTGLKENMSNAFALDIEDFLEELSINSIQPHAVLGVSQISGDTLADRDAWVENLTVIDYSNAIRAANVMAALQSKFISVAAFEPIVLNTGRGNPYAANGQAVYAGLLAGLPYDISPTNKNIPGIRAIRKDLSMRQYEAMNEMRYVSMRVRQGNDPVVVNDVTAAPYGSDFVSWSTYSITAEAADRVKRVAELYLGQPNSIQLRNAMDQDISNALQGMSGLQAYNFTISSTIEQQVLGVVEIDLIIVPIFTMKKIRTTVKLRKSLPTGQ